MPQPSILFPAASIDRQFAHEIVRRLVERGFTAYYAGGCVRDALLGLPPKDFDVATNATTDQVREVFGPSNTRAVGEAFGVVLVHGRLAKTKCQVEVATFRTDGSYSDGRRPDWVEYASPEEDAQRRDFTINGLFYDPIAEKVIDFVGGQADLERNILRAIGDPYERIREDKLRMLRAIRFASRYGFHLDPATQSAIADSSAGLAVVSGERIGVELTKILEHPNRTWAWNKLDECQLLVHVAPELVPASAACLMASLPKESLVFPLVLASLVHPLGREGSGGNELLPESLESGQWQNDLVSIQERWKLSNQIIEGAQRCVEASARIVFAHRLRWSQVQPLLVHGWTVESTMLAERIADHLGIELTGVRLASERVSRPIEEWNPNPLIDGGDLIRAGLRPSPVFGKLLSKARALQLDNELVDRISAVAWLQERIGELNQ